MPSARLRRWIVIAGGAAIAAAVGVALAPSAFADSLPYTDPGAVGRITLCDVTGKAVTSGSIHTKPFVWRAVGSTVGTGPYKTDPGRTAALYGYQPIKDVDPTQWNGEYLTASAKYTNPSFPMAGASAADPSLADLLSDYPAKWDGLIELRMFLGAPLNPAQTATYNASSIRVSGDTWSLIDGGSAGCDSGTARSAELVLPSIAKLGTPRAGATTDVPGKGDDTAKVAKSHTSGQISPSGSPGNSVGSETPQSSRPQTHSSNGFMWLWISLALLAVGAGAAAWWRRGRPIGRA